MMSKLPRRAKSLLIVCGAFLLTIGLVFGVAYWDERNWPEFPETEGTLPSVVVKTERDFGYRIGDLVRTDIYIMQKPGTQVDLDGLAIEGQFEIHDRAILVNDKTLADGTRYIHLRMYLQSFVYQKEFGKEVGGRLGMTWIDNTDGETKEIEPIAVAVTTSRTWDGKDRLLDGLVDFITDYHFVYTLLLLLLGVLGLRLQMRYAAWVEVTFPEPVPVIPRNTREEAKREFDAVWARIMAGDRSAENFRQVDIIIRRFNGLETVLVADMLGRPRLRLILGHCERVIFNGETLSDEELAQIEQAADEMFAQNARLEHVYEPFVDSSPTAPPTERLSTATPPRAKPSLARRILYGFMYLLMIYLALVLLVMIFGW